jgi:asparagine synthetase A
MRELVRACESLRELARACESLRELARACESLRELARACESLRELARACESLQIEKIKIKDFFSRKLFLPKKISTLKSKNFILMLPDLQSQKWNGHRFKILKILLFKKKKNLII